MSTSPDDLHGTDLLAQEIKEEASRLAHHPLAEVKRLEHVAEKGDRRPAAMLVLILTVTAVMAVILAVVISVALVVYYRG